MKTKLVMRKRFVLLQPLVCVLLAACTGGVGGKVDGGKATQVQTQSPKPVPTACLYTIGEVSPVLREAILDSLRAHYPKCRYAGNLPLRSTAITRNRRDHTRYMADSLIADLCRYQSDTAIVIGLTQADIGKDNFRNREGKIVPHWGIMGESAGIGKQVLVFSSYRPRGNAQLFRLMLHEIGHSMGLWHCSDPNCIMQDAKGTNPFGQATHFCDKCGAHMRARHWQL